MKKFRLNQYLIFVIFYNVLVILWGAYVRASGSGAGCGSHWPLCNGVVLPVDPGVKTQIEFFHRITSGLSLILVLGLGAWVFRCFPKNNPKAKWIRKPAAVACISILMEAVIGAGLVLFELVSHNQSAKRTISISLHFSNTLILLASLVMTLTSLSRNGEGIQWKSLALKRGSLFFVALYFCVGMAGAVTALGDTLFPAVSLSQGFQQDWNASSHFLLKLRIIHPILAVSFVLLATPWIFSLITSQSSTVLKGCGKLLIGLLTLNVGIGIWNLLALAPIPLQIFHLSMALTIWIVGVIFLEMYSTSA